MRILKTTMFFEDGSDPVLNLVLNRKALLIAKKTSQNHYTFDIRLRGEHETPFFDD
jgi:protocatechuate 3,4-dioxygenase beta subunit